MGQKYFIVATGYDLTGKLTYERVLTPEALATAMMFEEHLRETLPGYGGGLPGRDAFAFAETPRDASDVREVEAGVHQIEAEARMLSTGAEVGYWLPDQPFDPDNPINPIASGRGVDVEVVDSLAGSLVDLDAILG